MAGYISYACIRTQATVPLPSCFGRLLSCLEQAVLQPLVLPLAPAHLQAQQTYAHQLLIAAAQPYLVVTVGFSLCQQHFCLLPLQR